MSTLKVIEESIIGSLLLNQKYYFDHCRKLSVSVFKEEIHRSIYESLSEAYSKSVKLDLPLLANSIKDKHLIPFERLNELVQNANPAKLQEHIECLTEENLRQGVVQVLTEAQQAIGQSQNSEEVISLVNDGLSELLKSDDSGVGHVSEYTREALDTILNARSSNGLSGIDTGFQKLNDLTGGWQRTDLIVLGARPGLGKTTLALNFILFAIEKKIPSVFYSLEMSVTQIINTLVCIKTGIDVECLRTGNFNDAELRKIEHAHEEINSCPLFVYDNKRSITDIVICSRFLKMKYSIDFVVIDYLQLITTDDTRMTRNSQIEKISRSIKLLASSGDCNLTVLALSQLNRSVETRGGDKRPQLSDLRESGAIEQDADIVSFLYRDSYYSGNDRDNCVELIIAKNRHGRRGLLNLEYDKRKFKQKSMQSQFNESDIQPIDFTESQNEQEEELIF